MTEAAGAERPTLAGAYKALRNATKERGLYERRYWFYGIYATLILLGIGVSMTIVFLSDSALVQFLNSLFLAVVLVQAGMLAHDLSHLQVFKTHQANRFFGTVVWGLIAGISESKWYEKHNAHHTNVNHVGLDPDLDIPFMFSEEQVGTKSWIERKLILPYQHVLFWLALPFVYLNIVRYSVTYLILKPTPAHLGELALILLHFTWALIVPLLVLPTGAALVFFFTHVLFGGLYLSLVFAPNHKGEEVLAGEQRASWLNQITSSRNIRPSQFIFYAFGGLNFQIEHHLFPNMPRLNYWQAYTMVKDFCREQAIPYNETTWWGSLREIYFTLRDTARNVRLSPAAAS